MNRKPESVTLIEVGLRDGLQLENRLVPTDLKIDMVSKLIRAGIRHFQVTSFVNPRKVPQMADAEELIRGLPDVEGISYSGLALNIAGVGRALKTNLASVEVSVSSSDTHSRRNAGISLIEAIDLGEKMALLAKASGKHVCASIQCAFGCVYEGEIPSERILQIARSFINAGADRIGISDTTGMAAPPAVKSLLNRLLPLTQTVPVSLHFHDTRGLGLVNVTAALECGIRIFDTSFGGMGGCPFVPGAAGNIATEDTAYLMQSLGFETGIDIAQVAECTRDLESFLGKQFPARMTRVYS